MTEVAPARATSFRQELARKTIHLASSAVPIALAVGVERGVMASALGALGVVALIVEAGRALSPPIASRFTALFGSLLRAHESRRVTGATWLIGAMFAAVLLLPREAAIVATWAAAVGDSAAALIGTRFGRLRWARDGKSLEGSAACLLATLAGALLLSRVGAGIALLAALSAMVAERVPWPHDDNVRIVTAVGIVMATAMAR